MEKIKQWFTIKNHFKKLDTKGKKLLFSLFLYNLIGPIFSLFINAFLWRQSQDITIVAYYNLFLFVTIPVGFYLNGFLLKKFSSNNLYTIGLLLTGITVATLIFLSKIDFSTVMWFGLANGLASGLYWSNRNLLTLNLTNSNNRIYFSGVESAFKTLANIVIPLLIGYFIIFGDTINIYTPIQGYQIIAILMLLIIGLVGYMMTTFTISRQSILRMFLKQPGRSWRRFRIYELLFGFLNGSAVFLPVLIVLALVGQEETLGTIQSLAAIITAGIMYIIGKKLEPRHRIPLLTVGVILTIIGAAVLSVTYSILGVFIFFACKALSEPLTWVALSSLNYDLIDKENKDKRIQYAYVCDQEVYLNTGRIIGIIFFLLLIQTLSNDFALRYAPLCFAISQLLLILVARSVEKHYKKPV